MIRLSSLMLLGLAVATPAGAREAPWLIAPPALTAIAAGLGGPGARIEAKDDEEDAATAYCQGLGAQAADALLLSRQLLDRERKACETEAISPEPERVLGLIGLALDGAPAGVTRRHLWRALARDVSADNKLAANAVHNWREVDPALPDRPIALRVAVPPALIDALVFSTGCLGAPNYAKLDHKALCRGLRSDLPDGPDPIVVRPLSGGGDPVEGIAPTAADLASGRYPLARRAYLYVKHPHLAGIPGLADLLRRPAPELLPAP